jgi:hypothetical protein
MESQTSQKISAAVQAVTPNSMQGDTWFGRNKTKLLGGLGLLASFILGDTTLANDIPPEAYKWVLRVFSFVTLYLGFLNSPKEGT